MLETQVFKHNKTGKVYGTKNGIFYRFKNGGQWLEQPTISPKELIKLDVVIFGQLYRTLQEK